MIMTGALVLGCVCFEQFLFRCNIGCVFLVAVSFSHTCLAYDKVTISLLLRVNKFFVQYKANHFHVVRPLTSRLSETLDTVICLVQHMF